MSIVGTRPPLIGEVSEYELHHRARLAIKPGMEIDCVILWSNCPETYSYVYFECFAANTFILANSLSGNIAKRETSISVRYFYQ